MKTKERESIKLHATHLQHQIDIHIVWMVEDIKWGKLNRFVVGLVKKQIDWKVNLWHCYVFFMSFLVCLRTKDGQISFVDPIKYFLSFVWWEGSFCSEFFFTISLNGTNLPKGQKFALSLSFSLWKILQLCLTFIIYLWEIFVW